MGRAPAWDRVTKGQTIPCALEGLLLEALIPPPRLQNLGLSAAWDLEGPESCSLTPTLEKAPQ